MGNSIIRIIKLLLIGYAVLFILLFCFQRYALYHPIQYSATPQDAGLAGFEEVSFKAADGQQLYGWYKKAEANKKTIVYFHGNHETVLRNAEFFSLLSEDGTGVLGLEYRGYGKSGGKPTEQGFYADARAAINFLKDKVSEDSIIVFGRSIGTGVAVQMATEYKVGGVILLSPYTSISDVASDIYWFLPIKQLSLVKDKFDSLAKIKKVHAPLLVIHGEKDRLIPISYGKTLYAAANSPKKFVSVADSDHNDFDLHLLVREIRQFYGITATSNQ